MRELGLVLCEIRNEKLSKALASAGLAVIGITKYHAKSFRDITRAAVPWGR